MAAKPVPTEPAFVLTAKKTAEEAVKTAALTAIAEAVIPAKTVHVKEKLVQTPALNGEANPDVS